MEESQNGGPRRQRRETAYQTWKQGEGIPEHQGSYVQDLHTAEVASWPRMGQRGAFVSLSDQVRADCYLLEIAAGGETTVQHHLFEASLYVLHGRGATSFWQTPGGPKQTVEWERGSVFSPPLNCYYQHFNLDGQQPARIFALTNAPVLINLFRNPDFVFGDGYVFADRYGQQEDYFSDPGKRLGWRQYRTNFIPDIRAFKLDDYSQRGAGGTNMHFALANNSMGGFVSEFPPATYKMAHRHGHGPHVTLLDGQGYSLFWYPGEEPRRVDWKDGTIMVPQSMEFHQHFNTGATNARYLVFSGGGGGENVREGDRELIATAISVREGGDQIPYEYEDPGIYELFAEECANNGATAKLPRPQYAGAPVPEGPRLASPTPR